MIFHGVVGEDKREERSPSFFNAEEAVIVVNYLEKLLTNKQKVYTKKSLELPWNYLVKWIVDLKFFNNYFHPMKHKN